MSSSTDLAIVLTAKDAASSVLSGISQKFNGLGGAAKLGAAGVASLAAAATTVVGTLMASANKTVAYAGEVKKLSRELGLGATEASRLSYAGKRLGLDTDELSKSFGVLAKEIRGGGEKLVELGVQVIKAKDGNVDFTATLGNIADKFKAMPDGVDKTALSMDLFGKTGKDLIPFLNKGSGGLKALGDEAARLGLVLDQKTIDAATRFKGAQKDLGDAIEGVKNKIGVAFLPILADLATKFVGLVDKTLPTVVKGLDFVRDAVTRAGGAVLEKLTPVWDGVSEKARLAFGLITDTVRSFRTGDLGLLVGAIQETFGIRLSEPVRAFIGTVFTELRKIPGFLGQVAGSLGEMFDVLSGRRPEAGGVLGELIGGEKAGAVMGVLASIRDAMREAFDFVKPIIQGVIEKVGELKTKFEELPAPIKGFMAAFAVGQITGANDAVVGLGASLATMAAGLVNVGQAAPGFLKMLATTIALAPTAIGLIWLKVAAFGALALAAAPWILLAGGIAAAGYLLIANWDKVKAAIGWLGDRIGEFFVPFGQLLDLFQRDAPYAIGIATGAVLSIPGVLEEVKGAILRWIGDAIGVLLRAIGSFAKESLIAFNDWFNSIGNEFDKLAPQLKDAAWNAVSGFVTGIFDAIPNVVRAAADFAGRFLQGLKDAFRIESPSKEVALIGHEIPAGLAEGIKDREYVALVAAKAMAMSAMLATTDAILSAEQIGAAISIGMAAGITLNAEGVKRAAQKMAAEAAAVAEDAVKAVLDRIRALIDQATAAGQTRSGVVVETANAQRDHEQERARIDRDANERLKAETDAGKRAEIERERQSALQKADREFERRKFGAGTTVGGVTIRPGGPLDQAGVPIGQIIEGLAGGIGRVALGQKVKFWEMVSGKPVPIFHQGGVMPWDGLALLERGERITAARGGRGGGTLESATILNRIYLDGRVIAEVVGEHQVRRVDALGGRFQ